MLENLSDLLFTFIEKPVSISKIAWKKPSEYLNLDKANDGDVLVAVDKEEHEEIIVDENFTSITFNTDLSNEEVCNILDEVFGDVETLYTSLMQSNGSKVIIQIDPLE